MLRAPNTSLGITLLAELVQRAASILGPDWDIEIAETHHRLKADAPSGTALLSGHAAARGRGTELDGEFGRAGTGLSRKPGAIGFAALRGGTVAGEHDVMFLGPEGADRAVAPGGEPDDLRARARSRALGFSSASLPASIRCMT